MIVRVRVVFRRTVVGDWRFDYLSGSHLQSQVKSCPQMMVFMYLVFVCLFWRPITWRQGWPIQAKTRNLEKEGKKVRKRENLPNLNYRTPKTHRFACDNPTNCARWEFVANCIISLSFIAQHVIDKNFSVLRVCPSRWYGLEFTRTNASSAIEEKHCACVCAYAYLTRVNVIVLVFASYVWTNLWW